MMCTDVLYVPWAHHLSARNAHAKCCNAMLLCCGMLRCAVVVLCCDVLRPVGSFQTGYCRCLSSSAQL
jgi:hypothetical protein